MKTTQTVTRVVKNGSIFKYFINDGYYYGFEDGSPVKTNCKTLAGFFADLV